MLAVSDENPDHLLLRNWRILFVVAIVFSFFFNLLRLSGPLFIILVHDQVLVSQSEEKLTELFLLVAFFLVVMGLVDYSRRRLLARLGAQFQERFEERVFSRTARHQFFLPGSRKPARGLNEIDNLRGFFHSDTLVALLDVMWAPMFLIVVFYFHWMLGSAVILGILSLLVLSFAKNSFASGKKNRSRIAREQISNMKEMILRSADVLRSQEMSPGFNKRWLQARQSSRDKSIELSDWSSWFTIFSRQIRLLLQYSVLAIGAYLVLKGELSVGAMVASMFLSVRVFVPVGKVTKEWPAVRKAVLNLKSLRENISPRNSEILKEEGRIASSGKELTLRAVNVTSTLTSSLLLKSVDLTLKPGMVALIGGKSGSGKSVLARTILGITPKTSGKISYGGIAVEALSPDQAQGVFGYLPESISLVRGTVEENITGLAAYPDIEKVHGAANFAQMHEMIMNLPDGYQTRIDPEYNCFSNGQQYQIALARALYAEPKLLIIDEPDFFLKARQGENLRNLREKVVNTGGSVIILSREPLSFLNPDCRFTLNDGRLNQYDADANVVILQTKKV